ncbi:MAG: DNA/RNA helicase [Spirochaetaceae bacterium]|nr:MAG: DNA/RNA helicase [Spirochaetaceae bacterium]
MNTPDLLTGLNEAQQATVRHHGTPLLILAGAGSGKTRVITYKIAYLLQELGYHPREILAVTFTNKAAREMKERAVSLCPQASDVMIRTFHSFGAWLLRRFAEDAGLSKNFTIYDDDDMVSLLRGIYPEEQRSALRRVARKISRAKDLCLSPDDDLSPIGFDSRFGAMYAAYTRRLNEIGNVDFGDLILRPIRLLGSTGAGAGSGPISVGGLIRQRFRAVLVDEYQDSNRAQYQLLKTLVGPDTYICVVGDDDQSIYRFRGAEVGNILSFPDSFPGAEIHRLEQNYRSTAPILSVADAVVARNTGRLGKTLFTTRTDGPLPRLIMLSDHEAEAEFCRTLLASDPSAAAGTAILYRTNAQSRLFETTFARAGIAYRIIGSLRFYDREEIKDAIAYLKLFANPADEVAFRRIINKPSRGLGAVSVERIFSALEDGAAGHGYNLIAATESAAPGLSRKAAAAARDFVNAYRELASGLGGGLLNEFVAQVFERFGLINYHVEQDEDTGLGKRENLEEFLNAASMYPATPEGLVELLENLELDSGREAEAEGDARNAVTLITMHNTKGLEFDRVIITGLEDGLFPRSDDDQEELEEERRLFYVAVTRARNEVLFTSCRSRMVNGRTLDLYPSRFLQEIPQDLVDVEEQHLRRPRARFGERGAYAERATYRAGSRTGSRTAEPDARFPAASVVYHDEYGTGMVAKVWWSGAQEMVLVRFETGRELQFVAEYSGLERISSDSF